MPDIDIIRSSDSTSYQNKIFYDAYSNQADAWMKHNYGDIHVEFNDAEAETAKQFEASAKEAGLQVSSKW